MTKIVCYIYLFVGLREVYPNPFRHNDARHAYNHAYGRYEAYAILPYDFRHDHSRRAYIANGHYRPETSHRNNYHRYGGYGYPYNNYYYG